jgi:GntR family transcriptional regulator
MFVTDGARRQLLKDERRRFIDKEWPKVLETIDRLGLDVAELLSAAGESANPESEDD